MGAHESKGDFSVCPSPSAFLGRMNNWVPSRKLGGSSIHAKVSGCRRRWLIAQMADALSMAAARPVRGLLRARLLLQAARRQMAQPSNPRCYGY